MFFFRRRLLRLITNVTESWVTTTTYRLLRATMTKHFLTTMRDTHATMRKLFDTTANFKQEERLKNKSLRRMRWRMPPTKTHQPTQEMYKGSTTNHSDTLGKRHSAYKNARVHAFLIFTNNVGISTARTVASNDKFEQNKHPCLFLCV